MLLFYCLISFIHSYFTVCHLICLLKRMREWLEISFVSYHCATAHAKIQFLTHFSFIYRDSLTNETNKQTSCTKLITWFELHLLLNIMKLCFFFLFGLVSSSSGAASTTSIHELVYNQKKFTPNAEFCDNIMFTM